jgi:phage gp36-like protein
VPEILVKTAADIARYYLHGKAADKDSPVTAAYNQAVAWLKDVSKGLIRLDDGTGAEPEPAGGGSVQANPSTRVFRRDTLKGL